MCAALCRRTNAYISICEIINGTYVVKFDRINYDHTERKLFMSVLRNCLTSFALLRNSILPLSSVAGSLFARSSAGKGFKRLMHIMELKEHIQLYFVSTHQF